MRLQLYMVFTILLVNQTGFLVLSNDKMYLHLCMDNKTVALNISNTESNDVACDCQTTPVKYLSDREDYVHTPGVGSHKLHTEAKPWNDARKICIEENGHLAIINSQAEENVLVKMLLESRKLIKNGANTEEAYLGIHDFFKEDDWVTVLGESLHSTGYTHWSLTYWGGQPDNKDNNQNCAALIYQGGMDDVHCHESFAFFCELPLYCE